MPTDLYCIQMGESGPIKIGVSSNVQQRLAQLQTNQPYPLRILATLTDVDELVEKDAHRALTPWRLQGEWFEPSPEVEAFVWFVHRLSIRSAPERVIVTPAEEALSKRYYEPRCKVCKSTARAVIERMLVVEGEHRACMTEICRLMAEQGVSVNRKNLAAHYKNHMPRRSILASTL